MPRYDPKRIEPKWQAFWEQNQTFKTPEMPVGEKLYVLDMFPYPSGDGLHMGHPEGQTATDIVCRYARMKGKSVLHPMGWDAFGLPAEQYAIKHKIHPRITTTKNINNFRRQEKMLGFSFDWNREFSTTDPEYFRWTQWIFLQIYHAWYDPEFVWTDPTGKPRVGKARRISELPIPEEVTALGQEAVRRYQDRHRLAYQHEAPVNWCPALGTVLANEEVIDGKSERGDHPVVRIPMRQWMLGITQYAERLLADLENVKWPESIKALQKNWIGRSTGAEVDFWIGTDDGDDEGMEAEDAAAEFDDWCEDRLASGFPEQPDDDVLRIYTTRPDTLFGATYMVLAPEHPAVDRLTTPEQRAEIAAYRLRAAGKSDLDRTDLAKDKSGVFTGSYAVNPVNGELIPVWIADYVLISYGTGAIMAVPAHDLRDWEFAVKYKLPIRPVVEPPEGYTSSREEQDLARTVDGKIEMPFTGEGFAIHQGEFDGLPTAQFKEQITKVLAERGLGKKAVNYRLRDWLFSRQHFWGEPFPLWHELDAAGNPTGLMRADPESALPITLPEMNDFKPHGRPEPPLAEAPHEWLYKTDTDGVKLLRETNTMPQWAGSCWYYLRFIDPKNDTVFVDPVKEKAWMPVDLYIGGAEHAVLHLLYARFWHKLLFDFGYVSSDEPFNRLVNQGMILGEAEITGFQKEDGQWVTIREVKEGEEGHVVKATCEKVNAVKLQPEQVVKQGDQLVLIEHAQIAVESRSYKMSKSRGNVVNPDTVIDEYGADSARLFEMFMGPLEASKPWSMTGVEGVSRFLGRVWRLFADDRSDAVQLHPALTSVEPTAEQMRLLHRTIFAVTRDIDMLSFNTAISRMMEFVNEFATLEPRPRAALEPLVLLLSPFAPHLSEELWQLLGHEKSLAYEPWPKYDPKLLVESDVEIPVQVNGKLRAKVRVPTKADQETAERIGRADPKVTEHLTGRQVVKVVYVADRLLNFVIK